MKKVITYGTFDLLHIGHINLLKRAKALGDYLIVAVSTDEFNSVKGKKTIMPYEQRAEIVSSLKFVDEVIAETDWEQKKEDVKKHKIDIFTMGDDWTGKFDFLNNQCKVIYLPRTEEISSSHLKKELETLNAMSDVLKKISKRDLTTFTEILEKITQLK